MAARPIPSLLAAEFRLRQRQYLLLLSRAMTSRLDIERTAELSLAAALGLMNCKQGLIAIRPPANPDRGHQPHPVTAFHGVPDHLQREFAPLTTSLPVDLRATVAHTPGQGPDIEYIVEWDRADMLKRITQVRRNLEGADTAFRLNPKTVFQALHVGDEMLGSLFLFRERDDFSRLDREVLEGFVMQASIAVRNAILYRRLQEEQILLQTVIDNNAEGIMILNARGSVVSINRVLADIVEMDSADAENRYWVDILDLHNVTGFDFYARGPAGLPALGSVTCEGDVRVGGETRNLMLAYTPLRDERGELVHVIVNATDITRFKEEEKLKSTFVTNISHDLKTPLTVIKANLDLLGTLDSSLEAGQRLEMLETCLSEADRLEQMINDMLEAAKAEAGVLKLNLRPVPVLDFLLAVELRARNQTRNHGVSSFLDLPSDTVLQADEGMLSRVLDNLVGNAIKYSPDGGQITIGCNLHWNDKDWIVIWVGDEGIGIPEGELVRIFDQFHRVDQSPGRQTKGTGMGLASAKAIVEAHGGTLVANSTLGEGSTFVVTLPLKGPAARAPGRDRSRFQNAAGLSAVRDSTSGGRP